MVENEKPGASGGVIGAAGATVSYSLLLLMGRLRRNGEFFCPVVDLSSNGVRFLTSKLLKFRSPVELEIAIPGEKVPLTIRGRVVWASLNSGKTYRYQAGVAFDPAAQEGGMNPRTMLDRIESLKDGAGAPSQDWLKPGP